MKTGELLKKLSKLAKYAEKLKLTIEADEMENSPQWMWIKIRIKMRESEGKKDE